MGIRIFQITHDPRAREVGPILFVGGLKECKDFKIKLTKANPLPTGFYYGIVNI